VSNFSQTTFLIAACTSSGKPKYYYYYYYFQLFVINHASVPELLQFTHTKREL